MQYFKINTNIHSNKLWKLYSKQYQKSPVRKGKRDLPGGHVSPVVVFCCAMFPLSLLSPVAISHLCFTSVCVYPILMRTNRVFLYSCLHIILTKSFTEYV